MPINIYIICRKLAHGSSVDACGRDTDISLAVHRPHELVRVLYNTQNVKISIEV